GSTSWWPPAAAKAGSRRVEATSPSLCRGVGDGHRHCEERSDAAIQSASEAALDCFASLAMTARSQLPACAVFAGQKLIGVGYVGYPPCCAVIFDRLFGLQGDDAEIHRLGQRHRNLERVRDRLLAAYGANPVHLVAADAALDPGQGLR